MRFGLRPSESGTSEIVAKWWARNVATFSNESAHNCVAKHHFVLQCGVQIPSQTKYFRSPDLSIVQSGGKFSELRCLPALYGVSMVQREPFDSSLPGSKENLQVYTPMNASTILE